MSFDYDWAKEMREFVSGEEIALVLNCECRRIYTHNIISFKI